MTLLQIINAVVVLVGVPTIVIGLIYVGRKLQILDELQKTTRKIKHNIRVISNAMIKASGVDFDHTLLQDYSPLRLTEDGTKYLEETGFETIFEENEAYFFSLIDEEEPKTKYDVELLAIKSVSMCSEASFMNSVKIYLFNHPKDSFTRFGKVAGVYIRDKYLEKHTKIKE